MREVEDARRRHASERPAFRGLITVDGKDRVIEKERQTLLQSSRSKPVEKARRMAQLCGIGPNGSWMFALERFGWRRFANRREATARSFPPRSWTRPSTRSA